MSTKPILFSTPMVQAILDGRKTMTRRVIKPQPMIMANGKPLNGYNDSMIKAAGEFPTPKYQPGDILWVRETWFREDCTPDCAGREDENECPFNRVGNACYGYKAQYLTGGDDDIKWRPSIHMPKEAARIFLRVTDVRAERLMAISVQDAKDEGIRVHANGCKDGLAFGCYNGDECVNNRCEQPIAYFHQLWNSIYAKRGHGWNTNPWVWVYSFERVDKPAGWPGGEGGE